MSIINKISSLWKSSSTPTLHYISYTTRDNSYIYNSHISTNEARTKTLKNNWQIETKTTGTEKKTNKFTKNKFTQNIKSNMDLKRFYFFSFSVQCLVSLVVHTRIAEGQEGVGWDAGAA